MTASTLPGPTALRPTRAAFLAGGGLAVLGALAACSADGSDGSGGGSDGGGAGAAPVEGEGTTTDALTLASPHGETVLDRAPQRIAVVGGPGDLETVAAARPDLIVAQPLDSMGDHHARLAEIAPVLDRDSEDEYGATDKDWRALVQPLAVAAEWRESSELYQRLGAVKAGAVGHTDVERTHGWCLPWALSWPDPLCLPYIVDQLEGVLDGVLDV